MDLLQKIVFKNCSNGQYLSDFLSATGIEHRSVQPSDFLEEMQLSTAERLEKIKTMYLKKKSNHPPQFDIIPNVVVFQNFKPGEIQTVPISVINTSKIPYCLTFLFTKSPYFSITYHDTIPDKLAPGMDLQCFIHFNPDTKRDYVHGMKIITVDKEFSIPIIAIGPRPLLNFPDNVNLPKSLIHIGTEKLLLIKNIGQVPGIFLLHTNPPFYVKPTSGIIKPNEFMQVIIQFNADEESFSTGKVTVQFDTGEKLFFTVNGRAESADINLSKGSVVFEDTYMGLKCQKVVQLHNKSDHVVHFTWKKFNSNELDKIEGDKIKESLTVVKDHEAKKSTKLEVYDVLDNDINDKIYNRILKDEVVDFEKTEQFLYNNPDFFIIPISGDVYPNHSIDVSVVFSPTTSEELSSVAFCKVTGRADRLSLKLSGIGLGPKFAVNVDSIDLHDIYLFSEANFELVVENKGDIPGNVSYLPTHYDFGAIISCKPSTLYLKPFGHAAFVIKLEPRKDGLFIEEIFLIIEESKEKIKIIVKGNVIYAKLEILDTKVNFGKVSLGLKQVRNVTVYNRTSIDIPFLAGISPDGQEPPLELTREPSSCDLPKKPKEYNCVPSKSVVPSHGSLNIEIELTANTFELTETNLCVDAWLNTKHRIIVKVIHHGCTPDLSCVPNDINIRFCFINYSSERFIAIKNKTNLCGYMWLSAYNSDELEVQTDIEKIYLEPYATVDVQVGIICKELGRQTSALRVLLFGGKELIICRIQCVGQGPIILFEPEVLNFGPVTLLESTTKTLEILNDSPIPAELTLSAKNSDIWSVTPKELKIDPEESKPVEVSCYLDDTRKYKGKIVVVDVYTGKVECTVSAVGVGTSIAIEPPFSPILNLQYQLTHTLIRREFKVINKGPRHHKILIAKISDIRNYQSYNPDDIQTIFNVEPHYFSLRSGESIIITVTGQHDKIEYIEESIFFHAIIEDIEVKQIIIETKIVVHFEEPNFHFSKKELLFRADYTAEHNIEVLTDVIEVTNNTPMPIMVQINVKSPFHIIAKRLSNESTKNKILIDFDENETQYITFCFTPNNKDKHSYEVKNNIDIIYMGHRKRDYIKATAQINYPNVKLIPSVANFGCVIPGSTSCFTVELRNTSPLIISYKLEWSEEHIQYDDVPDVNDDWKMVEEPFSENSLSSKPTEKSDTLIETDETEPGRKSKEANKKDKASKEKKTEKSKKGSRGKHTISIKPIPTEFVFEHYYTETYLYDFYVQIFEKLHEPLHRESLIGLTEQTLDNLNRVKSILIPITIDKNEKDENVAMIKCMEQEASKCELINEFFNVSPSTGNLDPFESQHLFISYFPKKHTSIKASLLFHVEGGPTETLTISGLCSDIHYEIASSYIDFGRQVFSEISEKRLKLKNKGYAPFGFSTTAKEVENISSSYLLEAGCLTVQPRNGYVEAHSDMDIHLRYFPGIAGKFLETFDLEIGHLAPVTITVSGYGVFPQIHLNLRRPSLFQVDQTICYEAIANLKSDFLAAVEHIRVWTLSTDYETYELPKEEKRKLQKDGWSVISYNNKYPSEMDIDLSIERVLTYKQIYERPSILLNKTKGFTRIGVACPPYLINFGIVIIGTIAHYSVIVLNYGPSEIRIRISRDFRKKELESTGFDIQFKQTSITVGDTTQLYILFSPTLEKYPERYYEIDEMFSLDVIHGLTVPIQMTAILTKPFIALSSERIDFKKVNCGNFKTMNFIVTNKGVVRCLWKIIIVPRKKNDQILINTVYKLQSLNGSLEPGESRLVDVSFEPNMSGIFRATLDIRVHQNNEKFSVSLNGEGINPRLIIDKNELNFDPCVPYANHSVQCFSVENPCDFPIEYYFPDFDKQILEEEKIKAVLSEYYGSNNIMIPERFPGDILPETFYEFCAEIVQRWKRSTESDSVYQLSSRSKKRSTRKKTNVDSDNSSLIKKLIDEFMEKSYADLSSMVQDLVQVKLETTERLSSLLADPVGLAIKKSRTPTKNRTLNTKEGFLFIFHGAPLTDYIYAANKTAKQLHMPVFNLNDIIYEALIYGNTLSCIKINELIDNAFILASGAPVVSDTINLSEMEQEKEPNPHKILEEKIELLLLNMPPAKAGGVSKADTASKGSKKSTKSSKESKKSKKGQLFDNSRTLIAIPEELLVELLTQKLMNFKNGIVIESLNNKFISQPMLTFYILLKAAGNLKYIHCVILHNSFEEYEIQKQRKFIQSEVDIANRTQTILDHFDSMTEEEFDQLSEHKVDLYRNIYLAERKERTKRRLENLYIKANLKHKKLDYKPKSKPISVKAPSTATRSRKTISVAGMSGKKIESSSTITTKTKKSLKSNQSSIKLKKEKLTPEDIQFQKDFDEFDKIYYEILHVSEHWDRVTKSLTKEYSNKKAKGKKEKSPKSPKSPKSSRKGRAQADEPSSDKPIEPKVCDTPLGFPFWVMAKYNPETIPTVLQNVHEYQNAFDSLQDSLLVKLTTSDETFSIIHPSAEETKQVVTEEFKIWFSPIFVVPDLLDNTEVSKSSETELYATTEVTTTDNEWNLNGDNLATTSELTDVKEESTDPSENFESRVIIQPGEKRFYCIRFSTDTVGEYEYTYNIKLTNWEGCYNILCKAKCDTPRICTNPKIMFPQTINEKTEDKQFLHNVFVKNTNIFDLGYKLLCTGDVNREERFYQEETFINIKNISAVTCEISIHLMEPVDTYRTSADFMLVPSNEKQILNLSACPNVIGLNRNTLALSIKDNPRVELINMQCCGCLLDFAINNKNIVFERILLNHHDSKKITLINKSPIALNWKFINADAYSTHFIVEPDFNFIKPQDKNEICVTYLAPQIESTNIKLFLEVYNEYCRGGPLLEDIVAITAETCNLLVECVENINFGEIKAKKDYHYSYDFLNQGKYNVLFEFVDIPQEEVTREQKQIRNMFKIDILNGTLFTGKLTTVSMIFHSKKACKIKAVPILQCNLLDHLKKTILSSFPITLTVKTLYSEFVIYPIPDINFGTMLVGTSNTQRITITNVGKVEFKYTILCKRTLDELQARLAKGKDSLKVKDAKSKTKSAASTKTKSSKDTRKSKDSKKTRDSKASRKSNDSQKSKKSGKSVKLGPTITCGRFICKNSSNVIEPKQQAEIDIECHMNEIGVKEEMLIVFVSECGPEDTLGKILNLKAIGCLPNINFDDYDKIFVEHFIVQRYEDFNKPKELGNHCVFSKEDTCLTFNNTFLNTVSGAQVNLYNDSLVECEINVKLQSSSVFKVKPIKLFVPSYSQRSFTIEFKPTELQMYRTNLELTTVMPGGYKPQCVSFTIMGEGRVPQITLKETCFTIDNSSTYEIKFDPLLIEKCCKKPISFENSGDMPCKVIIEVRNDDDDVFSLEVEENTTRFLNCSDTIDSKHAHMVNLIPGDVANIYIKYEPKIIAQNKCSVIIHIINNPYDIITININGESFAEDIVLDELKTGSFDIDNISSVSDISLTNYYGTSYIIDFGCIYLNTLQKTKFRIINRSNKDIYKFVFRSPILETVFIPAVGHLKPNAWKDVFITFVTENPVHYKNIFMDCLVCKIIYSEFVDTPMSWDERQQLIVWDDYQPSEEDLTPEDQQTTGPQKLLDECPEPMYDVVEDSITTIPILFSVLADYTTYTIDSNSLIVFPDTFMFDKHATSFTIFNTSEVNLEIYWDVILDKSCTKLSIENTVNNNRIASAAPFITPTKSSIRPRPLTGKETFNYQQCVSLVSVQSSTSSSKSSTTTYNPFTIDPEYSSIPPKGKSTIKIIFAPVDVFLYKANLKGIVQNLSPKQSDINLKISAKSLIPCCHFDVNFSDYITSGRRQAKSCSDFIDEENTKVIEINCLGLGIQHEKVINIRNPTEDRLKFSWHQIKSATFASIPLFECRHKTGSIEPRKIFPCHFLIFPQSVGTFEAQYNFKIEKYDIVIPFLFVANARETDVKFLTSHLTLKPAVLGISVSDHVILRNNEDIDIFYKIKRSSLYSEGRKQCLAVEPRKGTLGRKSETKIKISFNPNDIGEECFTLRCDVDFAKNAILLPVTTKCFEVNLAVFSYLFGRKTVLSSDADNIINLGDMLPKHGVTTTICIRNEGNIGFYYTWHYNDDCVERRFQIDISNIEGYVKTNNEAISDLNVIALRSAILKNFKIELKIRYGPTYKILLNGSATNTTFKFSFLEYDFGPCLTQISNICYFYKTLEFFNVGATPLTLECSFINTNYLTIDFRVATVYPKSKQQIYICFAPRQKQKYSEDIMFTINTQKVGIIITGEGIRLDIAVVNSADKDIDLGSPNVGELVCKKVKVINKCASSVEALFDIWDRLPAVENKLPMNTHFLQIPTKEKILEDEKPKGKDKGKNKKDNKKSPKEKKEKSPRSSKTGSKKSDKKSPKSSDKRKKSAKTDQALDVIDSLETEEEIHRKQIKSMISITPRNGIVIPSNRTAEFTINYFPTEKIQPFIEKISVQVLECVQPLCMIKGSCVGPVFYFDRNEISFGVVVSHCVRETKIILFNEGDVSSRFKWICDDKNYSIVPMQGYSTAGLPVTFTVKYHPYQKDIQTKYKAQCALESLNSILEVLLIGVCADMPAASGILSFNIPVRSIEKKSIVITNSSGYDWTVFPSTTGDYFSCCERIKINAKSNANLEVIYEPLVMTKDIQHKGYIFIKLPSGDAIVYDLIGEANRPEPVESRVIEIPCKTNHKEIFIVKNWSNITQEFKMYTEDITPGNAVNLYEIKGLEFIEIMASKEKEFEWHFYAYKECFLEFRVIFMNNSKEYLFYHLLIKVTKAKPLETIALTTCVRTPVTHKLLLINPLDVVIYYKIISYCSFVSFQSLVAVEPHSEVNTDIVYMPLLCDSVTGNLEASCPELGSYLYELKLTANAAPLEETIQFSAALGQFQVIKVPIENLAKVKATFKIEISDEESFSTGADASINLIAGQKSTIPITFYPFKTGKVLANLTFTSEVSGDYNYPLVGICTAPTPKGPFAIYPEKGIIIDFVNPFLDDETFSINVEPNNFIINCSEEFIKSRALLHICVTLSTTNIPSYNIAGKLTIYPKNRNFGNVKWVYYLEGSFTPATRSTEWH